MKTRKVKIKKFLCLFVTALAVFAFSGCGGNDSVLRVIEMTSTQSEDVTPDTPTSPDVTGKDTAIVDTTLDVNDSTTASNILKAVNAGSGTEVAALPEESVGTARTLADVPASDLAAIPSTETPAAALPIMTADKSAVYVFGMDLSSLTSGDYIFLHMFTDTSEAAGFYAAADSSGVFLDDSGNKITRVPAGKRANAAAYMEAGNSYSPLITTRKSDSSSDSPSVPVVPAPQTSTDVQPIADPTSSDTRPSAPASGDTQPTAPISSDVTTDSDPVTEDETVSDKTYTSTTAFENALMINGAASTYTDITVNKTGDASGQSENYDWYGTNAAVLAKGGATVTITGAEINSNAVGGNAVFAYGGNSSMNTNNSGDGTKITISDSTITTQSSNSGGIMVTGGGTIEASDLTITTSGGSSAAIRSDRGGGTITVNGGTYTTSGTGSPAIYSTAAITGTDVTLESKTAQVVVIEGGNSVTLIDSSLTANHNKLNGQDTSYQAVLIYQSQSGDASSGSSSFRMSGGDITNTQGDIFHVTNTTTTITIAGSVTITNNDSSGAFLRASSDSWGSSGSNGGKVTLNADGQDIDGDIVVDSVSTLTFNMSNSSNFNGAINTSGQNGTVSVVIDSTSTWTLTGNSYVSSLTNNGTIDTGDYNLYVNGQLYTE